MFVADRIDEVLHVIVAFARVGTPYLQIATWFRFIDLNKLLLGFLVVEHLGDQNHVTRFGIEEIAVLARCVLQCEPELLEVNPDLASGPLVVHLRNSCMTSSDKPHSAPHWRVDLQPDATDGNSLYLRTYRSASTGDGLLPPRVTTV